MSVFKRDASGDMDRGTNGAGFSRVTLQEEARVRLETVLRLAQGEVKRDIRVGLDHEYLFDPLVPSNLKANHIVAVMIGVPGITDAQIKFTLNTETGELGVEAEVVYDQADQEGRTLFTEQFMIEAGADIGGTTI